MDAADDSEGGRTSEALLPVALILLLVVGLVIGGAVSFLLWARQDDTARVTSPPGRLSGSMRVHFGATLSRACTTTSYSSGATVTSTVR